MKIVNKWNLNKDKIDNKTIPPIKIKQKTNILDLKNKVMLRDFHRIYILTSVLKSSNFLFIYPFFIQYFYL